MQFKKILFIGIGFMGGSIIKFLKKNYPNVILEGAVRRKAQFEELKKDLSQIYLIDEIPKSDWDLVIISTPVETIADYVKIIQKLCLKDTIITDVGSTKNNISLAVKGIYQYLGSHPMAGSEKVGFSQAKEDLYFNKVTVLCPTNENTTEQIQKLSDFWTNLGSIIIIKNPEEHDEIVAYTSHLTHALSFLFANLGKELNLKIDSIYGNSFLDFTRISASDPTMWLQIFQSNKKNLVDFMEKFIKFLCEFTQSIEKNDWKAVESIIVQSNQFINELKCKN